VPNNSVLSAAHAQALREYVEAGGTAIVEGEGLNQENIRELFHLAAPGEKRKASLRIEPGASLATGAFKLTAEAITAAGAQATVEATANGEPCLFSLPVGKGKLVGLTPLLSAQLRNSREATEFYQALIAQTAGFKPVRCSAPELEINLFTDGVTWIIATHNPDYLTACQATVALAPRLLAEGKLLDLSTGVLRPYTKEGFNLELRPREYRFYRLGAAGSFTVPANSPALPPVDATPTYAETFKLVAAARETVAPTAAPVKKRVKKAGTAYAAVFNGDDLTAGEPGLLAALQNRRNLEVEYIRDLTAETLAFYDVVIIPCANKLPTAVADSPWREALRNYVAQGGGVLLLHNSCGLRGELAPALFPEVATPIKTLLLTQVRNSAEHPVLNAASIIKRAGKMADDPAFGAEFRQTVMPPREDWNGAYVDQVALTPGASGLAVARAVEADGTESNSATVVVGDFGQGKVVLCGTPIGIRHQPGTEWDFDEITPTSGELSLLVNAVFWLAEKE